MTIGVKIGQHHFLQPLALAPMAGVSDLPFRSLCRALGADYAVSEMVTARRHLWSSRKTRTRLEFGDEARPHIIQIAGAEPAVVADAARHAVGVGADVVDINMGCPAKKVCNRLAGSALLKDESLVAAILTAAVAAVSVPVTLKMRTGWDEAHRNGVDIARLAEDAGVAALTVHGRTRACAFRGAAEYDTIAAIKQAVGIPVVANGDIRDGAQAFNVLEHTGADGLMVGRGAQGNPWIFAELKAHLAGRPWHAPDRAARFGVILEHLDGIHRLYGCEHGARIARKHIGWYLAREPLAAARRREFNRIEHAAEQRRFLATLGGLELAAGGALAA
ncbi:MAG: tRNA dihydrouridine synthase DusB [Gammaproteobacteria bacterium]